MKTNLLLLVIEFKKTYYQTIIFMIIFSGFDIINMIFISL